MPGSVDKTIRRILMVPLYNACVANGFMRPDVPSEPRVAWPRDEKDFPVALVDRYIRFSFDPVLTQAATIGRTPRMQRDGFITCDLFWLRKFGEDGADDLLTMVVDAYPYAAELERDGIRVTLGVADVKKGFRVDEWFGAPVQINWTVWRSTS